MDKTYKTQNIYLASVIFSHGIRYLSIERKKDNLGRETGFFIFENYDLCSQIEKRYYEYQENVNARRFVDAFNSMKEILFGPKKT